MSGSAALATSPGRRRIDTDGTIRTIAGTRLVSGFDGDGGPAPQLKDPRVRKAIAHAIDRVLRPIDL